MYSRLAYTVHGFIAAIWLLADHFFGFVIRRLPIQAKCMKLLPSSSAIYQKKDLSHQIVIVTGSNTGIGKASATKLASLGATVILACRDTKKGDSAAQEINQKLVTLKQTEYPHALVGKAICMKLDLTNLRSVLDFSTLFKKQFHRLDILINNAGLNSSGLLPNGVEQLFQVNYLGHYLLLRCLEDLLRSNHKHEGGYNAKTGRVVNLSSVMHHGGQANFKRSSMKKFTTFMKWKSSYYSDSKFYMNLLTMEINRRYASTAANAAASSEGKMVRPLYAVSANPGAVKSDIWRNVPFPRIFGAIADIFFLQVNEGAETTVCAATVYETCLESFRMKYPKAVELNAGFNVHGDVPYFIPYEMPFPSLFFEMLGKYGGCKMGGVSFPKPNLHKSGETKELFKVEFQSIEDLSSQLWNYSAHLCKTVLIQSGVSVDEVAFLDK